MKYLVIDDCGTDFWVEEFETTEEAIEYADREFENMTSRDKTRRRSFYVLESVNPDEDADDHYDGNPIKEYI